MYCSNGSCRVVQRNTAALAITWRMRFMVSSEYMEFGSFIRLPCFFAVMNDNDTKNTRTAIGQRDIFRRRRHRRLGESSFPWAQNRTVFCRFHAHKSTKYNVSDRALSPNVCMPPPSAITIHFVGVCVCVCVANDALTQRLCVTLCLSTTP